MMKGIINFNKPKGMTSFSAANKLRRLLKAESAGHMGTLDPQGEGVLLVGLGKATRLFDYFLGKDKVYEADFAFGFETDTLDGDGKTVREGGKIPLLGEIEAVLGEFKGVLSQIPPAYSAKSIGGVRAYDLARQGKEVELKPARVEVFGIEIIAAESPVFRFRIHCSSGTYIRSICRDLAYRLETFATMTAIKRTRCGKYLIEDSVDFEGLEGLSESDKAFISVEKALEDLPRFDADIALKQKLDNGVKIAFEGLPKNKFTLFCGGILYGIAENQDGFAKIITFLKD